MDYNEFCNTVRNELGSFLLGVEFDEITIKETVKNNGTVETGLMISRKDSNIAPNINLKEFYGEYTNRMQEEAYHDEEVLHDILGKIADTYRQNVENMTPEDVDILYHPESVYENAYVQLVNYEANKTMLKNVPYRKYMDLAVIIRIAIRDDEKGFASAVATHSHMAQIGVNEKKLYEAALENTTKLFPPRMMKLEEMIQMLEPDMDEIPETGAYVLTNAAGRNGAAALLYAQEELETLSSQSGHGYYILPSSIHEVLLFPDDAGMPLEELQYMVREVNRTSVAENEILSDTVYHYDRESRKIEMEFPQKEVQEKEPER